MKESEAEIPEGWKGKIVYKDGVEIELDVGLMGEDKNNSKRKSKS